MKRVQERINRQLDVNFLLSSRLPVRPAGDRAVSNVASREGIDCLKSRNDSIYPCSKRFGRFVLALFVIDSVVVVSSRGAEVGNESRDI